MNKITIILIICLFLGCIDNRDSRYNKSYFTKPSNITHYTTKTQISIASTTTLNKIINTPKITISSWYITDFNTTKTNNSNVMDYITSNMKLYDISILQGIENNSVAEKIDPKMSDYISFYSNNLGSEINPQIYAIFYKGINATNITYLNISGIEKSPILIKFVKNNFTFDMVVINTNPSFVHNELSILENNVSKINERLIIIGNMNAGCGYYPKKEDFMNWTWAIPDSENTRSDGLNCPYDRIIINPLFKNNFVNYNIMRNVNSLQSKHYLISATMNISS
jgi:hypothetical protein